MKVAGVTATRSAFALATQRRLVAGRNIAAIRIKALPVRANWITLDGSNYLGIGTHLKYYIEEGGGMNDITPIRLTTGAGDVTFAASNGSTTITVTDASHGAFENDFVTFSGAASLGGNITAAVLNAEHQVVTVTDANTYTIVVGATANSSDSGNGGSSTVGTYQINVGLDTSVGGTGWGAGTWSRDGWGDPASGVLRPQIKFDYGRTITLAKICLSTLATTASIIGTRSNNLSTRAVEVSTRSVQKQYSNHRETSACLRSRSPRYSVWVRWSKCQFKCKPRQRHTRSVADSFLRSGESSDLVSGSYEYSG